MATITDIAKKLNISKGTVSKALNGASDVSETLRKTVFETAVELGYSRSMHKKDAKRLCIFIENMDYLKESDFGYDIILGFKQMAEPAGFIVEINPIDKNIQTHIKYDEYMLKHDYVGAFFLGLTLVDIWFEQLKSSKTPAVLLDNYIKANSTTAYVGVDNNEALDLAVSHLKSLGHRKIGYLSGGLSSYINQLRYTAFFHALRKHNLCDDAHLAGSAYLVSECIHSHLPKILGQDVTAIMCSHDLLAHAVMTHCQELGLRVPKDISIIGFDDLQFCAYTNPPLTTIKQNRIQLGKSAFYAISSLLNNVSISTLLLHTKLIIRNSTDVVPDKTPVYYIKNKKNT